MFLSVCVVASIRPLVVPKWKCYIVEEVIEVNELNKEKIFAAAGKLDKIHGFNAKISLSFFFYSPV